MKKKIITLLVCVFVTYISNAQTSTTPTRITRYGAIVEASGLASLNSSQSICGFGTANYQWTSLKSLGTAASSTLGFNAGLGFRLGGEQTYLLLGGGYEMNITEDRGQSLVVAGITSKYVAFTAKVLFSQFNQYPKNFEIAGMFYPGGGIVEIGGFYKTEYACNEFGLKLGLRIIGSLKYRTMTRRCSRC